MKHIQFFETEPKRKDKKLLERPLIYYVKSSKRLTYLGDSDEDDFYSGDDSDSDSDMIYNDEDSTQL